MTFNTSLSDFHKTTYDYTYTFGGTRPHAPTQVGDRLYSYDFNGNMTQWKDAKNGRAMDLAWDEDNRLSSTSEQGKTTEYRYDDAGQRVIKRGKYGEIAYVSEFYSLRNGEVGSKHIFAGNTRIATKMAMKENQTGGGKTHAPRRVGRDEKLIQNPGVGVEGETYTIMTQEQYDAMLARVSERNKGAVKVDKNGNAITNAITNAPEHKGKALGKDKKGKKDKKEGIPGLHGLLNALENGKGHKYGIYKRLGIVNAPGGGNGNNGGGKDHPGNAQGRIPHEHPTYYYHGDHLGSSNVITDDEGELYQHLEYFPYGEGWVDEHQNRTNLPFKFTGKELDPETGLYYFGARYYDPRVSMWISTDPILEKYLPSGDKEKDKRLPGQGGVYEPSNLSLYLYAGSNPVIMIDPDGNAKVFLDPGHGGTHTGTHKGELKEKNINRSFSNKLVVVLTFLGHNVSSTRTSDTTMNLTSRAEVANKKEADYFLSIHVDSHKRGSEMSVLYHKNKTGPREEQEAFATAISGALKQEKPEGMKVKSWGQGLGVLRKLEENGPVGALLEVGNIQSAKDRKTLTGFFSSWKHAIKTGIAIDKGIKNVEQ